MPDDFSKPRQRLSPQRHRELDGPAGGDVTLAEYHRGVVLTSQGPSSTVVAAAVVCRASYRSKADGTCLPIALGHGRPS
jgi:hypothetical protein